jgi:hypothetical protein
MLAPALGPLPVPVLPLQRETLRKGIRCRQAAAVRRLCDAKGVIRQAPVHPLACALAAARACMPSVTDP